MSAFVGVLVGAALTWLVARYYYRQATKDLNAEADRFARTIDGVLTGLESSGWCRVTRDESGHPTAIVPRFGVAPKKSEDDASDR